MPTDFVGWMSSQGGKRDRHERKQDRRGKESNCIDYIHIECFALWNRGYEASGAGCPHQTVALALAQEKRMTHQVLQSRSRCRWAPFLESCDCRLLSVNGIQCAPVKATRAATFSSREYNTDGHHLYITCQQDYGRSASAML